MSRVELVRASAGTGKTYSLVEEYVRAVVEDKLPLTSVVAITFTRKAAFELKTRVRARLSALLSRDALGELWQAPINNFHGLAVQLLSETTLEPALFVLGEEGEDGRLFAEACAEAWLGVGSEVGREVTALARYFDLEGELAPSLWKAVCRAREDGVPVTSAARLARYDLTRVRELILPKLVDLRARFVAARGELDAKPRAKIEAALAKVPETIPRDFIAYAEAWALAAKVLDRRGKLGKLFDKEEKELIEGGALTLARAEAVSAELAPHLARLIDVAWARYQELKRELSVLDFTDLIEQLIARLETDEEYHAEILRRFRHVLVDEAQDTNGLQRRLVHLLAGLDGHTATRAGFFVVGDHKQAIYTFRGANPHSFEDFAKDVRELGGTERTLLQSWRATPKLCAMINHLGARLFGESYEPIEAAPKEPVAEGALAGAHWLFVPEEGSAMEVRRAEAEHLAAFVAARIQAGERAGDFVFLLCAMTHASVYAEALSACGIPTVVSGGEALSFRSEVLDLAALLRWIIDPEDRLSAATALRSPLFGLSDSGLLRLLGEPGSFAALCKGELFAEALGPSDVEVVARIREVMPELWAEAGVLSAAELLRRVFELLEVEAAYAALPGALLRARYFNRLFSLAYEFDRERGPEVSCFTRELMRRIDEEVREPMSVGADPEAVAIGSVHQAKGLEFPVVLLADLWHGRPGDHASVIYGRGHGIVMRPRVHGKLAGGLATREVKRESEGDAEAELRRLLYVAVTRARRAIVFCGSEKGGKAGSFSAHLAPWREEAASAGVLVLHEDREDAPPCLVRQSDAVETPSFMSPVEIAPARRSFAVTELESYLQCPRRGILRHELRLEEPRQKIMGGGESALAEGRLVHGVLEALAHAAPASAPEAFVVERLVELGCESSDPVVAEMTRHLGWFLRSPTWTEVFALGEAARRHELPFVHELLSPKLSVRVRGQLDLLYFDEEGPVVLDFKYAKKSEPEAAGYRLQLELYALAAAALCGEEGTIRTRVVFLKSAEVSEHRVSLEMRRDIARRIIEVAESLGDPRGQPRDVCAALGCGFIDACHPRWL